MRVSKRIVDSQIFGRVAHADVLELSESTPESLVVLFGGSGIDEDEYIKRADSTIPVFDSLVADFDELPLVLIYVTAPYDVPLRKFCREPALAENWNRHVQTELLEPWPSTPYFVVGFSGGSALAFHGVHASRNCFGGATMGADGIDESFVRPEHWKAKLQMFVALDDRVCSHPQNQTVMQELAHRGDAEIIKLPQGGHHLSDYATNDCLGKILVSATNR